MIKIRYLNDKNTKPINLQHYLSFQRSSLKDIELEIYPKYSQFTNESELQKRRSSKSLYSFLYSNDQTDIQNSKIVKTS